jgi:hypothetical protein
VQIHGGAGRLQSDLGTSILCWLLRRNGLERNRLENRLYHLRHLSLLTSCSNGLHLRRGRQLRQGGNLRYGSENGSFL